MTKQLSHKVVFVGNSAVGKTTIISRFVYGSANSEHQPTVGIDFFTKTVKVERGSVRVQIWDTAGQEKFHSLIPSYIKSSTFAVFVFDITDKKTLDSLEYWYKMVTELANPLMMFVGNKVDLEDQREVTFEEGKKFAEDHDGVYMETSAVTPINLNELFEAIANQPPKTDIAPITLGSSPAPEEPKTVEIKTETPPQSGGCGC